MALVVVAAPVGGRAKAPETQPYVPTSISGDSAGAIIVAVTTMVAEQEPSTFNSVRDSQVYVRSAEGGTWILFSGPAWRGTWFAVSIGGKSEPPADLRGDFALALYFAEQYIQAKQTPTDETRIFFSYQTPVGSKNYRDKVVVSFNPFGPSDLVVDLKTGDVISQSADDAVQARP